MFCVFHLFMFHVYTFDIQASNQRQNLMKEEAKVNRKFSQRKTILRKSATHKKKNNELNKRIMN